MSGPKLLSRVRRAVRARHYSASTEEAYVSWVRRYVRFHGVRHPNEMGPEEISLFLTDLAVRQGVSAATQNQAASALVFLYRKVLGRKLDLPRDVVRARKGQRLPEVLTPAEARRLLRDLQGVQHLVASLLYGSGLRLMEALRMRVKDVEMERGEIMVRAGKGNHDRVTVLPQSLLDDARSPLRATHAHPPPSFGDPAWRQAGRPNLRDREAGNVSHISPLLRNASPRGQMRYSDRPGTPGPQERPQHDALHACPEPRWTGSEEPPRSPGADLARGSLATAFAQKERCKSRSVGHRCQVCVW